MVEAGRRALTPGQQLVKRSFDIVVSAGGLVVTGWVIAVGFVLAALDTRGSGFFFQERVGLDGRTFRLVKLRTMRAIDSVSTTVTTADDPRITRLGRFLRRTKIDELPQLWNVLVGDMSLVGPRPDVAGFADELRGRDRIVLSVRPGLTGPATLKYRNEEEILAARPDPERYNREVIFPDKVRLNREYVENYSFRRDLLLIWRTLAGR